MKKRAAPKPRPADRAPFFRPFAGVATVTTPAPAAAAKKTITTSAPPPADAPFEQLLYGVERLPRGKVAPAPPAPAAATPDHEEALAHLRKLVEGTDGRFEVHDDGRRVEGRRVDADAALVRRLRRGQLAIDGTLDLHGLDAAAARSALEQRLVAAGARGERTLLVVHGKGLGSPGGRGLLRGELAAWLTEGRERARVVAFCTALAEDGGEGAMYVRLR